VDIISVGASDRHIGIERKIFNRALEQVVIKRITVLPHINKRLEASARSYVFFYTKVCGLLEFIGAR